MSGAVVGGIVGAVIGSFIPGIGPRLGWMIGSAIGGAVDAPESEGPRLSDLRPQGSDYGRPIPIVYGTAAISGNVFWQTDLEEVQNEEGGKGGGGVTTYTYYANFAVLLCEGTVSLGRIWAGPEKRLIYDGTTLEGGGTLTFYNGSETQNPDPLMESHQGVGNVPAYRGWAYIVFENFPVANDGSRIPFLTVEVGTVSNTPLSLGTVWPVGEVFVDAAAGTYAVTYSGSTEGVVVRNLTGNTFTNNFTFASGRGSVGSFYDKDRHIVYYLDGSVSWIDLDTGTQGTWNTSSTWPMPGGPASTGGYVPVGGVYHNGLLCFLLHHASSGLTAISTVDAAALTGVNFFTGDSGGGSLPLSNFCGHRAEGDTYILGVTKAGTVRKYPLSAGFTSTSIGACPANSETWAADPNTGYVWTATFLSGTLTVSCNDPVTATQLYTQVITTAAYAWPVGGSRRSHPWVFKPHSGGVGGKVILILEQWPANDYFVEFESGPTTTPYKIAEWSGTYHGTGRIRTGWWNPTASQYWFVRDYAWANKSKGSNDLAQIALAGNDNALYPGSGFQLGDRGMTISGQSLSSIVANLCERAGITSAERDVTALTDTVDGFVIAQQTTVRGAIQVLQPAFYFDAVESQGVAKFVKRGGAIAVTIPDSELGAFDSGSDPEQDLLLIKRQMEDELPDVVTVRYINRNADYEIMARQARRLVGGSRDEQSVDLAIVMTDTKGQEVADTNLHKAWVGRKTFALNLPRKYSYLEPTDVISAHGQTMLLAKVTQADGVLKCEAVFDDFNYTPNVVVTETPTTGKVVYVPSETQLVLM